MTEQRDATGWFVNIKTGAVGQITAVDDSYAYLMIVSPKASRYAIPIADYDSTWLDAWRPATVADLPGTTPVAFRPPRSGAPHHEPPEMSMMPDGD
jgi:hypothetical protein